MLSFSRKMKLFADASASEGARKVRRSVAGATITPRLVAEIAFRHRRAFVTYLVRESRCSIEEAREVAASLAVVRSRIDRARMAICMKEMLLPNGEPEDGEWERVDEDWGSTS